MSDSLLILPSSNQISSDATSSDDDGPVILSPDEILAICADDPAFYGAHFFPKTVRQKTPKFHIQMYDDLTAPYSPLVSNQVFRGGAKTTLSRIAASYMIALGFSRTVLVVGKSQEHAVSSVEWLLKQAKFNKYWAQTFGIIIGGREAQHHIQLIHGVEGVSIRVLAAGMEGSLRGINFDDFRPDLILLDDPLDAENTATPEGRKKTYNLITGDLQQSLAPETEAPLRKFVFSQTPLNPEDAICTVTKDKAWKSNVFSCFDSNGMSTWEERYPTRSLLREKQQYIDQNNLSTWLREKECKLVSQETIAFPWKLPYWSVVPEGGLTVLACDPTPPPRDGAVAQARARLRGLDKASVGILRVFGDQVFLCELYETVSPDPNELFEKMFEMMFRWEPINHIAVETVLFARVLAWGLKQAMARKRIWRMVRQIEDRRAKETRIRQEISHYASHGKLVVNPAHSEFITQYTTYPDVNHDDHLDMVSIGLMSLGRWIPKPNQQQGYTIEGDFRVVNSEAVPQQPNWRRAP